MTLRDVTRDETKTLAGRYSVAVCLPYPGKVFPAADKAAVPSHLSSGTELKSRGISEYLPAMCQAEAGSPGVAAAHVPHPLLLTNSCTRLLRNQGRPTPHPRTPPIICYSCIGRHQIFILLRSDLFIHMGQFFSAVLNACVITRYDQSIKTDIGKPFDKSISIDN